jgi:hypothetical protein
MRGLKRIFSVVAMVVATVSVHSQTITLEGFESRKAKFLEDAITNFNDDAIYLQAFKGLPVNQAALNRELSQLVGNANADFRMVKLIRLLYFAEGVYDNQILPLLAQIPMWLSPDEDNYVYWSENHIIMWQGTALLLQEKYGWYADEDIKTRVSHWLDLKLEYGFYEYYSSVYFPFTLAGVLNIADFSEDPILRAKAAAVAQRLLIEKLLLVNDKGVFYPTAGRNSYSHYSRPYSHNFNRIFWMLTGLGQESVSASHGSVAMATTSVDMKPVLDSWKSEVNEKLKVGHELTNRIQIHAPLNTIDRTIFQWSMGAYFHPDVALETTNLFTNYRLWGHSQFDDFRQFQGLPAPLAPIAAQIGAAISKSSVLNPELALFKNRNITLSSSLNYWKGRAGYQQWPVVATAGTGAVFTKSGALTDNWENFTNLNVNTSLPYVMQDENVALIMYRPIKTLDLLGFSEHNIALHWPTETYDEVREFGNWIIGREDDSYVAARRYCLNEFSGIPTCSGYDGQVWAIIVGNQDLHGSFDNFTEIVQAARCEEKWIFEIANLGWTYYGMIEIDGKKIEHYWEGDLFNIPANPTTNVTTGVQFLEAGNDLIEIFPNPASGKFNIRFLQELGSEVEIVATDISGRQVYQSLRPLSSNMIEVDTRNWSAGMYHIQMTTAGASYVSRLIVK